MVRIAGWVLDILGILASENKGCPVRKEIWRMFFQ